MNALPIRANSAASPYTDTERNLAFGHNGKLGCEAFYMASFFLDEGHWDEGGKVGILMASLLEALVQVLLQELP